MTTYHYNADGTISYSTGAIDVYYTYDSLGRLYAKSSEYVVYGKYYINAYAYDKNSNVISESESMVDSVAQSTEWSRSTNYDYDCQCQ